MKVSVIIPAYNPNKQYLRQAINSALNQNYKAFEIILIDDHSDIPINYFDRDLRIRTIRTERNLGPAGARNIGISNSIGDLISFLDSDDIWHPNKLVLSVGEFEKNEKTGLTCGNYSWMIDGKICRPFYRKSIDITFDNLKKINYIPSGSVTVRKSVLDEVGLFNEKYWIGEDWELWLRISKKYEIKFINSILYYYRKETNSFCLTSRKDLEQKKFTIKDLNV